MDLFKQLYCSLYIVQSVVTADNGKFLEKHTDENLQGMQMDITRYIDGDKMVVVGYIDGERLVLVRYKDEDKVMLCDTN